jgi:antitoxin component of MazEF toxin-antitoxin module
MAGLEPGWLRRTSPQECPRPDIHGYPSLDTPRSQHRRLRIGRWGHGLAVRLPQGLSKLLNLQHGDELELRLLASGELRLTPTLRRGRIALSAALEELVEPT